MITTVNMLLKKDYYVIVFGRILWYTDDIMSLWLWLLNSATIWKEGGVMLALPPVKGMRLNHFWPLVSPANRLGEMPALPDG